MTFLHMAFEMQRRQPTTKLEAILREYSWANSAQVLDIVLDNQGVLRDAGLLEEAFIEAWGTQKAGVPNWTPGFCRVMFARLDRAKLLSAGDPLPSGDSFTVYRGVAGVGSKRRVRGYSWSGDRGIAERFAALRAERYGLPNPAVYSAVIQREHVLAYIHTSGRQESEFLLLPDKLSKVRRMSDVRALKAATAN